MAIEQKSLYNAAELKKKAEQECTRRELAGIWDNVEQLNPDTPPDFDNNLVGKQIEILWKYFDKNTKQAQLIWATGRIARVADGLTDTHR